MCKEDIIEIKMCVVRWRTTNKFDIIGLLPIKLEVAAPTQSWSAVCKQFQLYNPQWIISIKVKSAGTQKCFWNLLITKRFLMKYSHLLVIWLVLWSKIAEFFLDQVQVQLDSRQLEEIGTKQWLPNQIAFYHHSMIANVNLKTN